MKRTKFFFSLLVMLSFAIGNVWAEHTLVKANEMVSGEKYIITAVYSSTTYYLAPGQFDAGSGTASTYSSNLTESDAWLFTKDGDNWTISAVKDDKTYYLSHKATNNGVQSTTTSANYTIAASSTGASTVKMTSNSRVLSLYQSSNWRCYTGASGVQTISLYKVTTSSEETSVYSVTLMDDNSTLTEASAGAGVELPSRTTTCTDYTFVGWSETNCATETTTAPTIIEAGDYKPTKDIELYPVFKKTEGDDTPLTASVTISDYATANSWQGSGAVAYKSITADENITITTTGTGNNGKYYSDWRLYQSGTGNAIVTAKEGFSLTSVKFTFSVANTGKLSYGSTTVASGTAVAVSGSSATFTVGNTGSATNGQVKITVIEVKYTAEAKDYYVAAPTCVAAPELIAIGVSGTPAEFWKGDEFNYDGITVTALWDDETETDVTSKCAFSGYDMSVAGTQTVTATYKGETATYSIEVKTIANTQAEAYTVAKAIELIDAGKDLASEVYVKGTIDQIVTAWSDQYSNITYGISGFQLFRCVTNGYAVGDDVVAYGTLTKYNSTYELAAGNTIVAGEKMATLSIAEITVANGENITPVITTNIVGEYLIEYVSDNEEAVLAEDDEMVTMGAGVANITATISADGYKLAQTTFKVTVTTSATLESVSIDGALSNTTYTYGDAFDKTGLTATAHYSDGTTADVTETATWEVDPETLSAAGTVTVTVSASFGGKDDIQEYDVTVNKKASSITIANKELGLEESWTIAATTTPAGAELAYELVDGDAYVTLADGKLTGVTAGTAHVKATYAGTEEYASAEVTFMVTVLNLRVVSSDGEFAATSGNLNSDISYEAFKGYSQTPPAINGGNIRLYQGGGYITIAGVEGVTIKEVSITAGDTYVSTTVGVAVDDADAPTTGDALAKNATLTKSGLNCESISFYCLGTDKNSRLDIAAISVKYEKVNVVLESIAITAGYTGEFIQNSTFKHDDVEVVATYSNSNTRVVSSSAVFSTPDMTTTGTKTVEVSYTENEVEKTTSYDITVVAEACTSIALSGEYKTLFKDNEEFSTEGLVVKADYNSGRKNIEVTAEAVVSTPVMTQLGEQEITVSYGGQSKTYKITVYNHEAVFYESFNGNDGTGANDGQWSGSIATSTIQSDNAWTFVKGNGANKCAKLGAGSSAGSAETPAISAAGNFKLTFKAAAWDGTNEVTTLNLSATGATIKTASVTLVKAEWTEYTVYIVDATEGFKVKFEASQASNNRFFLDEVMLEPATIVATVGDNAYATLAEAVVAAAAEDEIVLLADVEENIVVPAEKNIVLDLNGHTLNGAQTASTATIKNLGTLTIENGTVKRAGAGSASYYIIENYGTMTLNCNVEGSASASLIRNNAATALMTFVGGEYTQTGNFIVVKNDLGEVIINDGTFTTAAAKNVLNNWDRMTINGGTFNGRILSGAYDIDNTNLTINGGTFNTEAIRSYIDNGQTAGLIEIKGGEFTNASMIYVGKNNTEADANIQVAVSGGTFANPVPAVYCADDFQPKANGDGTYGVQPAEHYTRVLTGFNAGDYGTICLEKAATPADDVVTYFRILYRDNAVATSVTYIMLEEVTEGLDAGVPYIFQTSVAGATLDCVLSGEAKTEPQNEDANGLIGSFEKTAIAASTATMHNFIITAENKLGLVGSAATVYVGDHRAYIHMEDIDTEDNAAPVAGRRRVAMGNASTSTTTGMENALGNEEVSKVMINGHLFIIRGEKMYNVEGQLVK